MTGPLPEGRRLSAAELASATPATLGEVESLIERGMLRPGPDGRFSTIDIQRVRAVRAMLSPGISLDELAPAFEEGYFTLEPIEMLFPDPSPATSQTFAGLADDLGLSFEELSRILVAAGFPSPRPEEAARVDEIGLLSDILRMGELFGGGELTIRAARIVGDAARRAAEAGLKLFDEGDEQRRLDHGAAMRDPQLRSELNERGGRLMRLTEDLVARMYRRHLEFGLLRVWATGAERFLDHMGLRPVQPSPPGLAFVDLAGFTALTQQTGDAAAARLAAQLAELAQHAAARHSGRVVKLLGDGAMLHFSEPPLAAQGALELVRAISSSGLPPARGGVHSGPVIERDGDYFGQAVNLTARVAEAALPGQLLATAQVANVAGDQLRFTEVGARQLKGIGELALYEVSLPAS